MLAEGTAWLPVTFDPEKLRQWTGAWFLVGLAALDIPTMVWELVVRRGGDPGVISAVFVIATIVLAGPVGIRIVKQRNGGDDE